MSEFKVGDRISITIPHGYFEGILVPWVNLDPGPLSFLFKSDTPHAIFHNCSGGVPDGYGYYVTDSPSYKMKHIGPRSKRTSGFGSFVKQLEL